MDLLIFIQKETNARRHISNLFEHIVCFLVCGFLTLKFACIVLLFQGRTETEFYLNILHIMFAHLYQIKMLFRFINIGNDCIFCASRHKHI